MPFMCDFETNTGNIDHTRVWAWASVDIDDPDNTFRYGDDISTFMKWLQDISVMKETIYFHNLKFDGDFIVNHLLKNGWQHIQRANNARKKTFTTLISGSGAWYCMTVYFTRNRYIKIIDSLKVIPLKVEQIPKAFGLAEAKGSIDYQLYREKGYELTADEISYISGDVTIVAKALAYMFGQGLTKMTQGSNALNDYKVMFLDYFKYFFPNIKEADQDIRRSYRGGFTYCNPRFQGQDVGSGIVLDVNSLYPSRMKYEILPYGMPHWFDGEYEADEAWPLYVQHMRCSFFLKDDMIPTIQIKNSMYYSNNEYLREATDADLWLTNVDLELFQEHYRLADVEYLGGYKFRGGKGFFDEYIDKWMDVKIEASKSGNKGMRTIAKLMLNSLYGKFGTNPHVTNKLPELRDDGSCLYRVNREPDRDPVYIPVATFITAYARAYTIRAAQRVYDRFLYADTDSLHLLGDEIPDGLYVDDNELGAWKHESSFHRAKFIRQKCYIEEEETGLKVTCAGMPDYLHKDVTWDNFQLGATFAGKLVPKRIDGGTILVETDFTIRA